MEPENIDVVMNPVTSSLAQDVQVNKWSDPPKDVLLYLLRFLSLKADLPRLRGVCTSWRSLLPDPDDINLTYPTDVPQLPNRPSVTMVESRSFLIYPVISSQEGGGDDSITPAAATPSRWLVKMIESLPTKWYLTNPLNLQELFMTFPAVEGTINLCDYRVLELCSAYSLVAGMWSEAKVVSEKVVVIPNFDSEERYYFTVLAIVDGGLFLWRTGEKEWTDIGGSNCKFVDAVSHHGKFFAYDLNIKKLVVIDPATFMATKSPLKFINGPPYLDEHLNRDKFYGLHLVVGSNGRLYLLTRVRRPLDKGFTMVVFLLKEEEPLETSDINNIWEWVRNIGDQIFFLGTDASFSLPSPVEHLPQWKPGSICLSVKPAPLIVTDMKRSMPKGVECLRTITCPEYFRYFELFDVENGGNNMTPFQELPKQVYTGLFFPPPPWVKWHCPNRSDAQVRFDDVQFCFEDDDYDFFAEDDSVDDIETDVDEQDWDSNEYDEE